jgi:hypothetical protein
MAGFEGFSGFTPEEQERIEGASRAKVIWEALEGGSIPLVPEDQETHKGIIDALEFLKEHNSRTYTEAERAAHYEKVDRYIETLKRNGLQKAA